MGVPLLPHVSYLTQGRLGYGSHEANQVSMRFLGPEVLGPHSGCRDNPAKPPNTRPWARASPQPFAPSPACAAAFCLLSISATYRKGYEMAGCAFGLKENESCVGPDKSTFHTELLKVKAK